jgi:integrase
MRPTTSGRSCSNAAATPTASATRDHPSRQGRLVCTRGSRAACQDQKRIWDARVRHRISRCPCPRLFRWALKARFVKVDPTIGVDNPKRKSGDGFRAWTEEDVAAYEAYWPIGTRQRVWLDVLLYTPLRRGDAVRLGRQHVRDNVATIKTEKSQGEIEVALPILPVLAETLAHGPTGDLAFICGEHGAPLTKESFGNLFKDACKAAGVPGSAHGVRKIAATRAANAGATVAQLEAIFGWVGGTMAAHYTRSADRRRLAAQAIEKLANAGGTSIPAPSYPVRAARGKSK